MRQSILDERYRDECPVRDGPDHPREWVLVIWMNARLPSDRSKGGENADIPTDENDEARGFPLFLRYGPTGHKYPRGHVTEREDDIQSERNAVGEIKWILKPTAMPAEIHDDQTR